MDGDSMLMARKLVKLRIYAARGSAFQTLFEEVMGSTSSDFTSIAPYGNSGDRKNDGYERGAGVFYQVYAPTNPDSSPKVLAAAKKAQDDFEGIKKHWGRLTAIREYRFVFNDQYSGCPAPVEQILLSIEKDHQVSAKSMVARHIEDLAMQLPEDRLREVIQCALPSTDFLESIDFSVLREVIDHIFNNLAPVTRDSTLSAPDFQAKISFNGLSRQVASILTVGSYQSEVVTDFFSKNSNFAKQLLRDHLAAIYNDTLPTFDGAPESERGDMVFFHVLKSITPTTQSNDFGVAQNAAIVVMSYFFESCDIFEHPDASA